MLAFEVALKLTGVTNMTSNVMRYPRYGKPLLKQFSLPNSDYKEINVALLALQKVK